MGSPNPPRFTLAQHGTEWIVDGFDLRGSGKALELEESLISRLTGARMSILVSNNPEFRVLDTVSIEPIWGAQE